MRPQNLRFFTFTIFTVLVLQVDSTQPPFSCDSSNPSTKTFPFCKTTLPISQRATDLVSRLTLEEKISQLVNSAQPIPRLGIPGYQWWSEALHGVSYAGPGIRFTGTIKRATSFPQVILSAASFDANQWYRISQAIGKEARALYNAGQATGMTFWAPNINIFRDPRWGRGQETPGEDPLMTGKYAVSYVRGLQGDSFKGGEINGPLQASACCKHFTAYDLENWNGTSRYVFDAYVTAQDLADTYQPPFKSCVEEGRASGIINFNIRVITILYIASDCDAVSIIHDAQGYAKTPEDAVQHTRAAVDQNKLSISEIDRALHNLFSVRMRLGLFNGNPTGQQFGNIGPDQVCSQENQMLALDAARNGIVLLKNSAGLLPLPKSKTMSLAVIGPNANSVQTLLGNYAGPPCKLVTPLQALQSYIKHTIPYPGCDSVECSSASIDGAVNIAKGADHVVLIMGLDDTQEKEGLDRRDLVLPGKQQELIISVAKAAKNPVVLVLLSGGPIDVSFAKNDENIGSILWAGYPGEAGAIALAEIIFGDHNPGGKLPMTWYPQEFVKVPMTDMRMRPEASSGYPGRTYRFYKGPTVFEFGYGLSYSKYTYELSAFLSTNSQNETPKLGHFPHIPYYFASLSTDSSHPQDPYSCASASQPPYSCDSSDPSTKTYDFCKTTLPISRRAEDLVSRLTFEEKATQLVDTSPTIPRLGIPAYEWWLEGLHGVGFLTRVQQGISFFNRSIQHATSFPQVILTAASFDAHIWYRIGQATGKEPYTMLDKLQAWDFGHQTDPRWGRGQETPGEDPLVVGKYGASFVRGVQGDSFEGESTLADHLQASACCKHYTAHDLDNWNGVNRFRFNAIVTLQDMADTYQPPFRSCVQEGKASGIMCSYNEINGIPSCAYYDLLTKTLRQEYITSDCDAVNVLHVEQKYAKTPEDAVADALKSGGRLPLTWYPQEFTKVPMTDMRMRPQPSIGNPGRTYRFYEGEKVFEFGYGLSYSDYSYAFASVAQNQLNMKDSSNQQSENSKTPGCKLVSDIGEEQCEHIKFKVTVSVKNEGQMAGKHPVLLFCEARKAWKGKANQKVGWIPNCEIRWRREN
ncbi:hypothetical protein NC651_013740 [Populus alba x Populus x berolinensis]|nr:hypothetical protein NC651_013740 [Populus alba x Populus x berolinensis]